MAIRVAVIDDYQRVAEQCADWGTLGAEAQVEFFHDHLDYGPELVARLAAFDVISLMRERTPMTRALLEQLPQLRLLVTSGRRNAAIDIGASSDLDITVCGTSSPGHATAELAMGLILSLARNLQAEAASVSDGGWQVGLGRDLKCATLGVIGLGRLGAQVAGFGAAFGMEVISWSENLTDERCAEVGVSRVAKDELFQRADFISIHLRLSDRTAGLVGEREIGLMKSDAYLVNTSRGPIVKTGALVDALRVGGIGGAALDVFDDEPLPVEDPLRSVPNLLLTPHIGYVTRETYQVFYAETVAAIAAWMGGNPINVITT